MYLYYLFLITYFIGSYRNIKKDAAILGKDYVVKIWDKVRNTLIVNLGIISPLFFYNIRDYIDYTGLNGQFWYLFLIFLINWVLYDIITYFVHRVFHMRRFYNLHRKSHEISNRIGLYYNSPIDFVLMHLLPLYFGLVIFRAHILLYIYFTVLETIYKMGRMNRDIGIFHRRVGNCNFGSDLFMDKLMGTLHRRKME